MYKKPYIKWLFRQFLFINEQHESFQGHIRWWLETHAHRESPNHLSTSGFGHFILFSLSFLNIVLFCFVIHNQSLNKDGNIRKTDDIHVKAEHKNGKKEISEFIIISNYIQLVCHLWELKVVPKYHV